jgi:hypothetical protein
MHPIIIPLEAETCGFASDPRLSVSALGVAIGGRWLRERRAMLVELVRSKVRHLDDRARAVVESVAT